MKKKSVETAVASPCDSVPESFSVDFNIQTALPSRLRYSMNNFTATNNCSSLQRPKPIQKLNNQLCTLREHQSTTLTCETGMCVPEQAEFCISCRESSAHTALPRHQHHCRVPGQIAVPYTWLPPQTALFPYVLCIQCSLYCTFNCLNS